MGVESKLAEHSAVHEPTEWKLPYHQPEMRALLDVKWGSLLDDSISGRWQPRRLGVEQLIKHVLGLRSQHPDKPVRLAQLQERVAGSKIPLHAMSYSELLHEWEALADSPDWLREHLEALRDRYSVSVPVARQ